MAYPKGKNRPAGAGRKKGTPNKKTQTLIERVQALGMDPVDILFHIANRNYKALGYDKPTKTVMGLSGPYEVDMFPLPLRASAAADVAQYIHPKRKAIEFHDKSEDKPQVVFVAAWGSTQEATDDPDQDSEAVHATSGTAEDPQ